MGYGERDILAELRAANAHRSEKAFGHKLTDWSEAEWGCAIAGEVGELCNLLKKRMRDETGMTSTQWERTTIDAAREMADVIIYVDLLASRMGISLRDAIILKFNEVSDRRDYPVKMDSLNGSYTTLPDRYPTHPCKKCGLTAREHIYKSPSVSAAGCPDFEFQYN